jgi:hypothetical protein
MHPGLITILIFNPPKHIVEWIPTAIIIDMHFWGFINLILQLCIDIGVYIIWSVLLFLSQPNFIQANQTV